MRAKSAAWQTAGIAATTHPSRQAENEAQVRALWAAYHRDGVAGIRSLTGPEVEWSPWSAAGEVLRGSDWMAAWTTREPHRPEISATMHSLASHGECVLATGSLRVFREGGFLDLQPVWVFFFRAGTLVRAAAFATREDAMTAIAEH